MQKDKMAGRSDDALFPKELQSQAGPQPEQRAGGGRRRSADGENKAFEARCEARDPDYALIAVSGLSVSIAQRIRKDNAEQMWDSVLVRCAEEPDGTLAVRVFISNPDWEELLQIACLRSRPNDAESMTPLGCNLDHVAESQT